MLRSLRRSFGGWLIVYLERIGLAALTAGLIVVGLFLAPIAAIVVASPLLAYDVFVLARLYGRLAWKIGEREIGRRKPRKKKAAPQPVSPDDRQAKVIAARGPQ